MDPNATLRLISEGLETGEDLEDPCADLRSWLERGGFEPDWDAYPKATEYYRTHI